MPYKSMFLQLHKPMLILPVVMLFSLAGWGGRGGKTSGDLGAVQFHMVYSWVHKLPIVHKFIDMSGINQLLHSSFQIHLQQTKANKINLLSQGARSKTSPSFLFRLDTVQSLWTIEVAKTSLPPSRTWSRRTLDGGFTELEVGGWRSSVVY